MNIRQQLFICFWLCCLPSCTYYFGPNRLPRHFKNEPATIPEVNDYSASFSDKPDYNPHDSIISYYANMPLPDWQKAGKTDAVRIILAKLVQNREVAQVNDFLLKLKPWSQTGTQWKLHPHGDYDFTEISFCSLLYLFGDKPALLYPETRNHVVDTLIVSSGAKQALRTPGSAGLFRETENHILMGEVSRYLKNQWLHEHGNSDVAFNNQKNGIEKWMLNHLDEKFRGGFYEFNSDPYSGYTMQALLTLFSFTHSDTVRRSVNKLLNEVMYEYSLSSINQGRYTVFRRQIHRAGRTEFNSDPISSDVRVLLSLKTGQHFDIREKQHGLITMLLHYRLNDKLAFLLTATGKNYFARLGHGRKGSPEIYTGGNGYVLSAGGLQRGKISQLAPRPIMLLLNDHVTQRDSCFYLCSKGKMGRWNNTGVYYNFACANQAPHIPPQYVPVYSQDGWQQFHIAQSHLTVVAYSAKDVGLIFVSDDSIIQPHNINNVVMPNPKKLFILPGKGIISYRLNSPKNKWVITGMDGKKADRNFDKWERINLDK